MQGNTKDINHNHWIKYPMHPRVKSTSYKGLMTSAIQGKLHAANQEAARPHPKVGRPGTDPVLHMFQPPQPPTDVWSASQPLDHKRLCIGGTPGRPTCRQGRPITDLVGRPPTYPNHRLTHLQIPPSAIQAINTPREVICKVWWINRTQVWLCR